ncbi:MAG: hypothetical protein IV100_31930 [Myxococcales bacterium]|nr:hypothetical protein [Myxococcales bacterium]
MTTTEPPEAPKVVVRPTSRAERWRRVALVVLSPLLMLTVFEYVLWVFDIAAPVPPPPASAPKFGVYEPIRISEKMTASTLPRIVCLGESTVAGSPFEQRMNMCTVMAEALGPGVKLINLASSAQDSNDILVHAKAACAHPQTFVYAYFGHNEFLHLDRYAGIEPPKPLKDTARFLSQFRFFRLIGSWVAREPSQVAFDVPSMTDAEVYERFEANYREVLDVCRDRKLVISKVISNPDLGFRSDGMTLRQSFLAHGDFATVPMTTSCRHCFRAGPRVNEFIEALAAEHAGPNLLMVDPTHLQVRGEGFEAFWDHCHPKPDVHVAMARQVIDAVVAAGWTAPPRETFTHHLTEKEIALATEDRAVYNLRYDPLAAAKLMDGLSEPHEFPVQLGLARAVAGYITGDASRLERGVVYALTMLQVGARRQAIESCLAARQSSRDGWNNVCLNWLPGSLVAGDEKAEFVARARTIVAGVPGVDATISALLLRLIEESL